MEYIRFGSTGLKVSRLCLGCMSYGEPTERWPWALDEEHSRPFIQRALELGINFFDTANVYSDGHSEEIVGRALKDFARREEVVLATKVSNRMRPGPNGAGLSRKAILSEIDQSLKRLGTDYVDLYIIHRWDYQTPIEETMEALHDVVKAGKARYVGASSMYAWQFAKALFTADLHGWTRFVSMQDHYNLLQREEEREMLPLCRQEGLGVIPWSPLAGGMIGDGAGRLLPAQQSYRPEKFLPTLDAIAKARGVGRVVVALAWLLRHPARIMPIVGSNNPERIRDAAGATEIELTREEWYRLFNAARGEPLP